ncbi:MAG: HAD family hydrolase [Armatimonadota bacterium]|nr:MAG: HAD family hydrolase [Armatimonadota bacterium]
MGGDAVRFRGVLFDLGQTLLEYPGNTHEFWRGFLAERLTDMQPLFRDISAEVGDDADAFVERAMDVMWPERKVNMSGRSWRFRERLEALMESYGHGRCDDSECERLTEEFYRPIGEGTRPYPETLEVLTTLRARGIRMAIISNAPWDVPGRLLRADMRKWEIEKFFDAFVMSGDVAWRKPNPEFMLAAARELEVGPEECLVVGDSLKADIAGARAAGMRSVWINREGLPLPAGGPRPDWSGEGLRKVVRIVVGDDRDDREPVPGAP